MPKVRGPINYGRDGKEIPPGTVFEVDDAEADHLIEKYGFERLLTRTEQTAQNKADKEDQAAQDKADVVQARADVAQEKADAAQAKVDKAKGR
jgi:hypothetical protein